MLEDLVETSPEIPMPIFLATIGIVLFIGVSVLIAIIISTPNPIFG